MKRALAMF